jgi:hypothetical protein
MMKEGAPIPLGTPNVSTQGLTLRPIQSKHQRNKHHVLHREQGRHRDLHQDLAEDRQVTRYETLLDNARSAGFQAAVYLRYSTALQAEGNAWLFNVKTREEASNWIAANSDLLDAGNEFAIGEPVRV